MFDSLIAERRMGERRAEQAVAPFDSRSCNNPEERRKVAQRLFGVEEAHKLTQVLKEIRNEGGDKPNVLQFSELRAALHKAYLRSGSFNYGLWTLQIGVDEYYDWQKIYEQQVGQ
jgi:hypothetical protein